MRDANAGYWLGSFAAANPQGRQPQLLSPMQTGHDADAGRRAAEMLFKERGDVLLHSADGAGRGVLAEAASSTRHMRNRAHEELGTVTTFDRYRCTVSASCSAQHSAW
jgi:hypothetical protein